ncbi:MAG: HAD-IA family hydrolase [Candidatus Marinimicrobia bacterium]|nr:HAD-IA family hydrolase [Candidatus Neomarinimicrobiota bacterium]
MVKIKTIFFDLFGVLLGSDQSTIIHHVAKKTELSYLHVKDIVLGEIFMRLERGEIGFKQYFQDLQYAIPNGNKLDYESFKFKWMNNQITELPTTDYLLKLINNYNLCIISNTTESHIEHLKKQFDLFENFNEIITSQAAGFHKPDSGIFNYALTRTTSNSESSIFVDDMRSNVESAQKMGFVTHHYQNFEGFESFINNYL